MLQRDRSSKTPVKLGTAEKKVLIVFLYYVILGVVSLVSFGISARTGSMFSSALKSYFVCESTNAGNCDDERAAAARNTFPGLTNASYILLALYPLVNLVYAFNFNELKEIWNMQIKKKWFPSAPHTVESSLDQKVQTTSL